MPEYVPEPRTKEEKARHLIDVKRQLLEEGDLGNVVELAMLSKTPKDSKVILPQDYRNNELRELGEAANEVVDRYIGAYATVEPKREPNKVESEEISRLVRLAKSGASSDAKTDLQAYAHKLMSYGVCVDAIKRKIMEVR